MHRISSDGIFTRYLPISQIWIYFYSQFSDETRVFFFFFFCAKQAKPMNIEINTRSPSRKIVQWIRTLFLCSMFIPRFNYDLPISNSFTLTYRKLRKFLLLRAQQFVHCTYYSNRNKTIHKWKSCQLNDVIQLSSGINCIEYLLRSWLCQTNSHRIR